MKIRDGFIKSEIMGQPIVVATRKATDKFNMLKLNGTAQAIWDGIASGRTEREIVAVITSNYAVSEQEAVNDVSEFVNKLRSLDIIDED